MKYATIYPDDTLESLQARLGPNLDQILADNGLVRSPNIGEQWQNLVNDKIAGKVWGSEEEYQNRQAKLLSKFVENSDIYETAIYCDDRDWKMLDSANTFTNMLYISDSVQDSIIDNVNVLGNNQSVDLNVHQTIVARLLDQSSSEPLSSIADSFPTMFSSTKAAPSFGTQTRANRRTQRSGSDNVISWFNIPQGEITLYSSLANRSIDIPAYPENLNDVRAANYTTMPDLLYQYEPWQMYQSSGPRTNTYSFHLHRDMWTGDHRDGKANELIRFCQAQCYPRYSGASVMSSTVALLVNGKVLISGIMNQVEVEWSGPLGLDKWYLEFTLALTITEVSLDPLNHDAIMSKAIVG